MKNIKITNVRAGRSLKIPGGRRLLKGQSTTLPVTMLMHKSLRKLIAGGRVKVSSVADRVESVTDRAIQGAREALDNAIDSPALEEASDKILDAAADAVEKVVDGAIDTVENAVEGALDSVADMLGLGDDEPAKEEKPKAKRRSRRKKSDS